MRIIEEIQDKTGNHSLEDQNLVGGYLEVKSTTSQCVDSDGDGLPDEFENIAGSDPLVRDAFTQSVPGDSPLNLKYLNGEGVPSL